VVCGERIIQMICKGRKKGTVRFSLSPVGEDMKVELAGDFNEWNPTRMRRGKEGNFVAIIPLSQGHHEYKFLVNGQWMTDPDNCALSVNPFGSANSAIEVA